MMTEEPSSRTGRTKRARIWLVVIFIALRFSDALCYFVLLRGQEVDSSGLISLVATVLWTSVFFIALWFRKPWARYLLITIMVLYASLPGMTLYMVLLEHGSVLPFPLAIVFAQFAAYAGGATILIRSADIRRFASVMSGRN